MLYPAMCAYKKDCGLLITSLLCRLDVSEGMDLQGINLDPSLYLVKLMVGGIDRSYDEGDEG